MPDPQVVTEANQSVLVTITYDDSAGTPIVTVKPSIIKLTSKCGCVIKFRRGGDMRGMMRVRFNNTQFVKSANPEFIRTGVFNEGDEDVHHGELLGHQDTTYVCELVVGGQVVATSTKNGGTVEPVTRTVA
jgi:hypothetical protein